MNRLLTILLLAAATTAHGQINNPPTPSSIGLGWSALTNPQSSLYSGTATKLLGYVAETNPSGSGLTGFNVMAYTNTNTLVIPANLLIAEDAVPAARNPRNVTVQGAVTIQYPYSSPNTIYGNNSLTATDESTYTNTLATWNSNTVTFATNVTASGTLAVTGNTVLSGVNNTMPGATNAASASSLMTRGLSDARYSPMPMTPQIVPWFYNGTLSVARVTNGSATIGSIAAYPLITLTTNAADSGAMIMTGDVWGAVDSAANPWNAVGKSVIIQGRLAATASNAVARFVWSSSTNWPTLITNVGTNGISNIGWAVETRLDNGSNQTRLIVNGATNKSESAWTPIGLTPGNDSSFMVVGRAGFTSLYWAATGDAFTRTPLITVTNQIGGVVSGAFQGGLGFAVINTNTPTGTSTIYIRRCYQVLGMTNYGY